MLYHKETSLLKYSAPHAKLAACGCIVLLIGLICGLLSSVTRNVGNLSSDYDIISELSIMLFLTELIMYGISIILLLIAFSFRIFITDSESICIMIKKSLYLHKYGNPLSLQEGELLPSVRCLPFGKNRFMLRITTQSSSIDKLEKLGTFISSALKGKYKNYAVTITNIPMTMNTVEYIIEDVSIHKELVLSSADEIYQPERTKLIIQNGTYIDLTTSGSILVSGKTRSGKTTGIISLLLQVLQHGRDCHNSNIVIVDPKRAELSQLPHTVTIDDSGEATAIINAIQHFADNITTRQQYLNQLSKKSGDAVKWWDAGMNVSLLFIDEYVACRTLFPKRADKDNPHYSLTEFDNLVKRIVTMGASAGCYAIISIAEASVEEGGLPSMLKHAMSTKILFKPTMQEGRLMWDSSKLENFHDRTYFPGDAWFSSTDGMHDDVTYVHFPVMQFSVYKELGELLDKYYR